MRLKEYAKHLDKLSGGLIRSGYNRWRRLIGWWALRKSKSIVAKEVGVHYYNNIRKLNIVVFPNRLMPAADLRQGGYAIEKIFLLCGILPRQFSPWVSMDLCINWQDLTFNAIDTRRYISNSYAYTRGLDGQSTFASLNLQTNDISKKRIAEINRIVFDYDLDVDPVTYTGSVVCKSDENATHDGKIIACPIGSNMVVAGKVYSVTINNIDGDEAIDFRVPYIGGFVGFFYEKRRPSAERFSNNNTSVQIRELLDEFTNEELENIERFCKELKADYGELDVLRDRTSGLIYIVDFAKTPAGPPNGLPHEQAMKAIERMSVAFVINILLPLLK